MVDAHDIIDDAEPDAQLTLPFLRDVAEWFHEHEGELFERNDAKDKLHEEHDLMAHESNAAISQLVGDCVDPIVQVKSDREKYVGVVEFREFEGAYGYIDWDDRFGKRKRVVCQQCVNEATLDEEVSHATEKDPNGSFSGSATYDELYDRIRDHYAVEHEELPSDVETGASLASGTTIGGNTSWHSGNDGSGSLLDAQFLEGRRLYIQSSIPSNANENDIWIDTS